ncbi:hypothetical protein CRE_10478 [Caenorhabditis remanei]|uniref:Sdz-33 F-box domain-containing protein n=1 Tax=Caenorhabditis remanei TaxID=31234 RepID=E3N0R3_CAERE|nr:hypothetical protein CRE_10478 [Caenorhabditis remanei]
MTTPFPLLRLPRLALIPVFQQMKTGELNDEPLELSFNTVAVSSDVTLKWLERVLEVIDADSNEEVNLHGSPRLDVCTKSLTIFADRFSKFKYSIQAFFVSNSLRLKLKQWSLMEHSINQFLTKWLQSEHNSPLEHLSIDNDENFYIPHVLEGLDAVPFLEERLFHYSAQLDIPPKTIYGGYDIRGMNGKKVTIRSGFYRIDFYVWP